MAIMTSLVPLSTMSVSALFRETATAGIVSKDVPALGQPDESQYTTRVAGRRRASGHSVDADGGSFRCMPLSLRQRLIGQLTQLRAVVALILTLSTELRIACMPRPKLGRSAADHHATSGA